jgi:uncharacterized protein YecE (DUF72 family)
MIWVGTSGYNYPEWKGSFYPADLSAAKMLPYYAARFSTVEINYTFYRMPTAKTLAGWAQATPDRFRLTLKAPRRITHDSRLRNVAELTRTFCALAVDLGPKRGALLFQLPPSLKKDVATLAAFLETLPPGTPGAFEFRHASWFDDEVFDLLRRHGMALCVAESEKLAVPVVVTAGHAYFRLRDEGYTPKDLKRWAETIRHETAACTDVFVYFKHEEAGKGPEFAKKLVEYLEG